MTISGPPRRIAAHVLCAVLVPLVLVSGVVLGVAYLHWRTREYFVPIVLLCAAVGGLVLTRVFASTLERIAFGVVFTAALAICLGVYWLYLYCFLTLDCL